MFSKSFTYAAEFNIAVSFNKNVDYKSGRAVGGLHTSADGRLLRGTAANCGQTGWRCVGEKREVGPS